MPSPYPRPVDLTDAEAEILRRITRKQTAPQHVARRARVILLMHEGLGNTAIAGKMDIARSTVEQRRRRWVEGREARRACSDDDLCSHVETQLSDAPRAGAPVQFCAEEVAQILALSLKQPSDFDLPVTHWTPSELAREAVRQGIVDSISPRTVGRFLKSGRFETESESVLAQPHGR